jgi:hypothetical protein
MGWCRSKATHGIIQVEVNYRQLELLIAVCSRFVAQTLASGADSMLQWLAMRAGLSGK